MRKILRQFLTLVCCEMLAWSTAYTSSQSGNWSVAATWGGAGVPGNGDTATIAAGHTVTVDVDTTVGTSPVATTTVLTITTTGALHIAAGVTFVVRGDTIYTSTASGDPVVLMNPGSTWEFDSSQAADPPNTSYVFRKSGSGSQPRAFQSAGTAAARCTVRSNAGGAGGRFLSTDVAAAGPAFVASYTDFLRLGGAASTQAGSAMTLYVGPSGSTYSVTNSTFTDCGRVRIVLNGGTHAHTNNVHLGGINTLLEDFVPTVTSGTPDMQIVGNVFTGRLGESAVSFEPTGFTMTGNYFAHRPMFLATGAGTWAAYSGNLQLLSATAFVVIDNVSDSYFAQNTDGLDRHFTSCGVVRPWTVSNSIFEWTGTHTVSGDYDIVIVGNAASEMTFGLSGNVFARAMGALSGEVVASGFPLSVYQNAVNSRFQMAHNSGWMRNYAMAYFLGTNATSGLLTQYKSNLMMGTTPVQVYQAVSMKDACATDADCDYNSASAGRTPAQYYTGSWTVPPGPPGGVGANDTEVAPRLADTTRQMPNFDVRYLGLSLGPTWITSTSYAVGDIVSAANSDVYSGEALNYRCIVAHTSGDSTRPGTGASWRTNWEWAALYQIRQRLAAQARYTDGAIGCSGCTVIQALIRWVRRGWTPQNLALYGKAHDGGTPGAAEMDKPVTRAWW